MSSKNLKSPGDPKSQKIQRSSKSSVNYHPASCIDVPRRQPSKLASPSVKKNQSNTDKPLTRQQSTPTGKLHVGTAANEALKREKLDAHKKAEETKKKELLAMKNDYESRVKDLQCELKKSRRELVAMKYDCEARIKDLQWESRRELLSIKNDYEARIKGLQCKLKESQRICTQLQMQILAEVPAAQKKPSRQTAQLHKTTMAGRQTVGYTPISSVKHRNESAAVERAVGQVLKEKEKEISTVKDELRRCKEELGRVNAERAKEVEIMRARLQTQNESMNSLRAGQSRATEADKAKTEMRRELDRNMQMEVLKQKEKEMNEFRVTLLKEKEQEIRAEMNAKCRQQIEQLNANMIKEKRKEMDMLRAELLRENEREVHEAKAEMTQKIARQMDQFKIEVMKEKGKEQWRGRDGEIVKLKTEMANERDREVKKVREQNEKEMERMRAMLLRDKEDIEQSEREMEKLRTEAVKSKIELDKSRVTLKEKGMENDKLNAIISEKEREIEALKLEAMKERGNNSDRVVTTKHTEEKHLHAHALESKEHLVALSHLRGRDGEIVKLKTEMANERDREVKKVREENEKEMERMRAMLLRDKEEIEQSERKMEKLRTEAVKSKIQLDKSRVTLKEKEMEIDKLNAVISEKEGEIEALKLEVMKERGKKSERVLTTKHTEEKHSNSNRSSTSLACSGHGDALCAKELNRTNTKAKSAPRVHGLFNLGNTCYMNAALQCVYATVAFKDAIMKENLLNGELTTEFRNILQEMLNASKEAVKPLQLKLLVQNSFRGFSGSSQQDSQEFLTALLEKLHEELSTNGTASESVVSKLFHGQLQTTLHCEKCHQDTIKCDPLMFLSVSIPPELPRAQQGKRSSIELTDCLETFTKEEFFGDNCWFCTNCNKHADMRRKASVSDPPQVLIVYLKRFRQDAYGIRHKITATVHFTRNLDLTPFVTSGKKTTYSLYAIINHAGSISTGHYTAFCKHGTQWYQFDDARVTALNENEIVTSNAYVLFYTRDCYSS